MSGAHTPGPWDWCCGLQHHITHGQFGGTAIPRGNWIADVGCGEGSRANARLIAAAPELLEALEALALYHENGGHLGELQSVLWEANAAIAKAKGSAQ